ncbi:glycosyltransferase [Streptomyces sp. CC77]|uniref:glycosyltransferase n=1 Tax=Streptomyces sp. CC77 TaxID=1906739 RepID=UPI0008DE7C03|nr:glycosyltransferase [Streptomyces sp. CC77]OII68062.1 glycosyltransferase [Streptomyces sp. CC77]
MRLHTHDYRAPDTDGIVDGAVLMHREMADLLTRRTTTALHDLTTGPRAVSGAGGGDVVYAGSGPYAFLYHHWRERHGGDYRIVREVHTALWSGYWAQEELCAPLVRPGDLALFPTAYTRRLFLHHFPSVTRAGSAVAYPMLDRLPRRRPRPVPAAGRPLRIGYLGAMSLAKNVDQVLSVYARCHRESRGRVSLLCAGKPNDPRWEPDAVRAALRAGGDPAAVDALRLEGIWPQRRLAAFFDAIDVLLFPSTASRETLGRVVLEALAHGVPVLAADVGPAVELLPARNLVPTALDTHGTFGMGRVGPLGRVDEDALTEKLLTRDFAPAALRSEAPYTDEAFLSALRGDPPGAEPGHDRTLPDAVRVAPRPPQGPGQDPAAAADRLFLDFFQRRDEAVHAALDAHAARTGHDDPALRRIVDDPARNLADYRAFPRLLDALVLPPLTYTLAPAPVGAGNTTGGTP